MMMVLHRPVFIVPHQVHLTALALEAFDTAEPEPVAAVPAVIPSPAPAILAPIPTAMNGIPFRDFSFEGKPVRVVDREGNPWFIRNHVCAILGHANPSQASARLETDEKGVLDVDTPGGTQETAIISESGLYSLIMTSQKPEAKEFRKWVTGTVLPSIRRTGSYGNAGPDLTTPQGLLRLASDLTAKLIESQRREVAAEQQAQTLIAENGVLGAKVERLAPRAAALDRLAARKGAECITDTAKVLGCRPGFLFKWLAEHRWTYRRTDGGPWRAFPTSSKAVCSCTSRRRTRPDRSFTGCPPKGRAPGRAIEREQTHIRL